MANSLLYCEISAVSAAHAEIYDRRDTANPRGPAELEKSIDERRARLAAASREIDISETK
jgi:hypothetical protein